MCPPYTVASWHEPASYLAKRGPQEKLDAGLRASTCLQPAWNWVCHSSPLSLVQLYHRLTDSPFPWIRPWDLEEQQEGRAGQDPSIPTTVQQHNALHAVIQPAGTAQGEKKRVLSSGPLRSPGCIDCWLLSGCLARKGRLDEV